MSNLIEPVEDGLPLRESGPWAKDKLRLLEAYMSVFHTSMKKKSWRAFHYIDILAGTGKNRVRETGEIMLGSPLVALKGGFFNRYFFVEASPESFEALEKRVAAHPNSAQVALYKGDANLVVESVCAEIERSDKVYMPNKWQSLNLAFIDPEGPEDVQWTTIERLARVGRMDMIINMPTSGISRLFGSGDHAIVDAFFGTAAWREELRAGMDASVKRRHWLDLYKQRLMAYGYQVAISDDVAAIREYIARNSREAQLYTLFFVSKHELGNQLWSAVLAHLEPRLF
jgi:three-Cys-motif partner protein